MTFKSLYEAVNGGLGVIAKQHFMDNFDGGSLNERWTFSIHSGSASGGMSDAVDQGYAITTGTTIQDSGKIHFNDIVRHYEETGSVIITSLALSHSTTIAANTCCLANILSLTSQYSAYGCDTTSSTNWRLISHDGTFSATDGSTAIDTSPHNQKLQLTPSSMNAFLDGVLDITKTSNRPTLPLQPLFFCRARAGSAARELFIRYCEVYNT